MNERKELYDILNMFHSRLCDILFKVANKKDVLKNLQVFVNDFYDFKETYKKIEAPNDKDNASI